MTSSEKILKFDADTITDQKRLVRGEQLLRARRSLRARDHVHDRPWRVMMLPGGKPAEEINAIRELMPKAHITAVDKSEACLLAATEAGADNVVHCELEDFQHRGTHRRAPAVIHDQAKFDLIILDLCSTANLITKRLASVYRYMLTGYGVFIFNFVYGRDVAEVYIDAAETAPAYKRVVRAGVPEPLAGRISYVFTEPTIDALRSVAAYKGTLPMCSCLFAFGEKYRDLSFLKVEPGDFEIAVTMPDPSKLYACPKERIESLRRTNAALKAAHTRKIRAEKGPGSGVGSG